MNEPVRPPRRTSSITPMLLSTGASWKSRRLRSFPGSNHLGRGRYGQKMKTSVMRCNECIVYHNWHPNGDWKKSFVKIVTGDFVDVPRSLANNIKSQISDEVKLQVPDGKTYLVQVSKEDNGLVFRTGWAAFASTYDLEQGDCILFEFSGSSCFEVRIFDRSCCEKESSCVAMNDTPSVYGRNMSHDSEMAPGNERSGSTRSKYHAVCKGCTASHYWHHMDKMRFFLVMMDVGDFKNGLIIPKKFADNVRGQISEEIMLELPDGQTYSVQVDKEQHKLVLGSGWDAFASAYELEEGDMLLFGYSGNSHFKVRIFSVHGCDKLFSCVMKNITHCGQSPTERTGSNDRMMNKSCRICTECVARHYWHMNDHDWCFFKVMSLSNFKNEMAIPEEFTANFRGHISDKVSLEVPDGKIYSVHVTKEQDTLVLRSGWGKFSGAYELQLYDLLLFTYSGNSHFKVRIMKKNCCEKELSCVAMNGGPNVQERDVVHEQPLPTKRRCQNDASSHSGKILKMTPGDSPSQKLRSGLKRYVVTRRTKLTREQKRKIEERLDAIKPDITILVSLMQRSRTLLYIQLRYAYDHLPPKGQTVRLRLPEGNRTWKTKLRITDGGKIYQLSRGWSKFTNDNNLQQGDMCLFELLKNEEKLTMNVYIIRGD